MAEPAVPIAIVRDYDTLHAALRARAEQIGLSREAIDEVAGLTKGHASKLLAPQPIKYLGRTSFGLVLGALGIMLLVVEDPEAIRRKATKRDERMVRKLATASIRQSDLPWWVIRRQSKRKYFAQLASAGGRARAAKLKPAERTRIARRAGKARWRKPRPTEPRICAHQS